MATYMKYVVTAISRLTGQRVIISSPKDKGVAEKMMERQNRKNHGRGQCLYRKLRVEPAESEQMLPFASE